jgi:hypothetical protein
MISPSPTQPRIPEPTNPVEPEKNFRSKRPRAGQTPLALFIKGIFRPIFRLTYYSIQFVKGHKLLTLVTLLLLLASISVTNYLTTGILPFGIGYDPFNFQVQGKGGGQKIQNWLYALRDGDTVTLRFLSKDMSQPPDPNQLVNQFSESKTHLKWKSITVIKAYEEPDSTIDSFIQVELASPGPGGETKGFVIWHFVSISSGSQDYLLSVDLVDARTPLR